VERWILDKALLSGTLYRTETDKYLVVRHAGTNSTSKGTLKVDGAPVLEIVDLLARPQPRDVHRLGPFDLRDCFIVVPRSKTIVFEGASGSYLRIVGELYSLLAGEAELPEHNARWTEQPRRYYSYLDGVGGIGENATWAAGAEYTVIDYTIPAGERWLFNRYAYVERTGVIADDELGMIALRFYVNDRPLDVHDPGLAKLGIDTCRGHYYADTTSYFTPFSVEEMPLELPAGSRLTIKAVNISGGAITTAAGQEAKVKVYIWGERRYVS